MSSVVLSKNMPQKFNVADGGNSFILGRKAFFNNTYQSHKIDNLGNKPKPLPNNASDLRTQRLRLSAIGSGSVKLKDINDKISFNQEEHQNVINNAKTRVRGGGAANVPKSNSIPKI